MDIGETLYVTERRSWRDWLKANFGSAKEIWLVYPNKASGEPCILYNDAVEEALCFGWIDSIIKKLDYARAVQRFSPRKHGSSYSQPNRERLRWLDSHGLLHPSIRPSIKTVLNEEFVFPEDILHTIRKNEQAWKHYQGFSEPYRRIRVAYIDSARSRPEMFQTRLRSFLKATEKGRQLGHGGIDKYF